MSRMILSLVPLVALPVAVLLGACEQATSIGVNPAEINLGSEGATMDIEAEPRTRQGLAAKGVAVTFRSRDPNVATVSPSGTVTAVAHGTTTIEVQVEGTEVMEFVHVVVRLPDQVEVRPTSTTCYIGGVKRLAAKVLDRGGKEIRPVDITWSSSDVTKATVADGEVTGVNEGEVTISATALGLEGTSKINVTWAPGQKALLEAEKRGGGGRRGGGGGHGGGGSKEGGGWDPRLSAFGD